MTSLAGAVQALDSGELLESLRLDGGHNLIVDGGTLNGLLLPTSGASTEVVVPRGRSGRPEPTFIDSFSIPDVGAVYVFAKRFTDIVGSIVGLVLLSPLIAVFALLIKLSDGGPVFYPHTRVGKWGREFRCMKFRTMVVNADHLKPEIAHLNTHEDDRTFKVPDDPRITRIGRFLRRTSMDELPQLWNVMLGNMSLVGPRPPVPLEVERYDLDDMQRLMVKPGLTCIWQVSGRSRLPFPKQLEMDLAYIQQRNYWLDLKLILQTLPAVLSADGAY
jgi:lipopolysaccharide/colanic/teichoic acid biosynthesis glycosyltransferase